MISKLRSWSIIAICRFSTIIMYSHISANFPLQTHKFTNNILFIQLLYLICTSLYVVYLLSISYEEGSRLMKREVVKLITPGTLLEPLDQHANYLLSIFPSPSRLLGLAWIDLSTAAFQVILPLVPIFHIINNFV